MCRQDPIPVVNEDTGETYPDEFFPDKAFFDACYTGDSELLSLRLAKACDVNVGMPGGWTALMLATHMGQLEVVRQLLEKGVRLNAQWSDAGELKGSTALMMAVRNGELEVVRLLIEEGAQVNDAMVNGWTALMLAANCGHLEVVRLLSETGARGNIH